MIMKEHIIHGTTSENLKKILINGFIDNNLKKRMMYYNKNHKQIFTQLIYKNIPNESTQIPYWFKCAIILDKKLFKDFPFYACNIGAFSETFREGINKTTNIVKGNGNLIRIPSLSKLKKHINETMDHPNILATHFMHSHEILFGKKISIAKYCKCIVIAGEKNIKLEKICNKLGLPFKYRNFDVGINNLLNLMV